MKLFLKNLGGGLRAYIDQDENNPASFYDDEGRDDGILWSKNATEVGYLQVTDIQEYLDHAFNLGNRDFKCKRDGLKELVVANGGNEQTGFQNLSDSLQLQCAGHLIGRYMQRVAAFQGDFEAMEVALLSYKEQVQACRNARYKKVENSILNYIPQYALQILMEMGMLGTFYRDQGIDGLAYDDPMYGLSDYFAGTAIFDGVQIVPWMGAPVIGLKNKGWTVNNGQSIADYTAILQDILFDGGL